MGSAREGPIDSLSDLEERFRGSGNKSPKGESFASIHIVIGKMLHKEEED